jgi:hypothetical protein
MPSFSLLSALVSLQAAALRIEPFKYFNALKMTFTPISYVYAPTAPRPKRTKSGYKTTEHVGTSSKKNQHIQPSPTALDILQPSVAEDADGNGDEGFGVQGEFDFESFCRSDYG